MGIHQLGTAVDRDASNLPGDRVENRIVVESPVTGKYPQAGYHSPPVR